MRLYLDQMLRVDLAEILRQAIDDGRTLVTLDEHFGDWAVLPLVRHPGVIRLKIHPTTTANAAKLLLPFLETNLQEELQDHLIIVSRIGERWIRTAANM